MSNEDFRVKLKVDHLGVCFNLSRPVLLLDEKHQRALDKAVMTYIDQIEEAGRSFTEDNLVELEDGIEKIILRLIDEGHAKYADEFDGPIEEALEELYEIERKNIN